MTDRDTGDHRGGPVGYRLLSSAEWHLARDARLAALRDAPEHFLAAQPHESSWTEKRWRRSCLTGLWAVAEVGGRVVGLARVTREETARHLESVWTHESHRRRGVASELIRLLLYAECGRRPGQVFVWVIPPNPAAFQLYASLGFEPTHERQTLDNLGRVEERLRLSGAILRA